MALAIKSGAPVITAYSWREGPGRAYGAFVRVDIAAEAEAAAEANTAEVTIAAGGLSSGGKTTTRVRTANLAAEAHEKCLQALEKAIEQHPEQWVATLWPIWNA
jgi:lauroyl/myristoyl acyltransferase